MMRALLVGLRRDRFMWVAAAVLALVAAPYLLSVLSPAQRVRYGQAYADLPLLLLGIVAFEAGRRGVVPRSELRFWNLLSAALGCWVAVRVLNILAQSGLPFASSDVLEDTLYVAFYLLFVLALELEPHGDRSGTSSTRRVERLRAAGAILFTFTLLLYFAIIPESTSPRQYATFVPSLTLFLVLDLYLVLRLTSIRRAAVPPPWGWVYDLLLLTVTLWFVTDAAEALGYMGTLPRVRPGSPIELLWMPANLTLVAAGRARGLPAPRPLVASEARSDFLQGMWGGPLMAYAVGLPVIHLVVATFGFMDPASRFAREVCVLVGLVTLAALALIYQRSLEADNLRLSKEHEAVTRELSTSRRLEAVGRLTGGVAHDFNNILTVILASADLIGQSLRDRAAREDLDQLMAAARRGTALVRKLLGAGGREVLKVRPVDLSVLVHDLYGSLRRIVPEAIEIRVLTSTPGAVVRADPGALEQILFNLVTNARDAMPGGGVISLETGHVELDEAHRARYGWGEPGVYGTLSVVDTGLGMDAATREKVFEPFFTTKEPGRGTGLGMALVYGLVSQQGGFIDLQSVSGQGTSVRILLPWTSVRPEVVPRPRHITPEPGSGEVILVVDDEAAIRNAAQRALTRKGFEVLLAADGNEALQKFRSREDIALVVSDVAMPGMSGPELEEAVRRERPGTPFILMSGYAARSSSQGESARTNMPFLQKPWTVEELVRMVNATLSGHARGVTTEVNP